MTVQERLRQRFEAGFSSVSSVDQQGILKAFSFLCDSRQQAAQVVLLVKAGRLGDAFDLLPPRIQLQAVEFVEGKPIAKK